jgi:hypothetical protein
MLLWYLVPMPVRTALRARAPLDCRVLGGGECLMVSVGSGVPLRWLHLEATGTGEILCRLWEVRQKTKELASCTVHPDQIAAYLLALAAQFNLGA